MSSPQHFVDQLSTHFQRQGPPEQWSGLTVSWFDLRRMKLGLGSRVPVVAVPRSAAAPATVDDSLIRFSREHAGNNPTIVLSDDPELGSRLGPKALKTYSVAVLPPAARAAFIEARDAERRIRVFGRALASDLGAGALSPYQPGKPASGPRFFGRDRVIDQVVAGKSIRNCTIVGNRRIGKTSLLHEIRERLSEIYVPNQSIHFAQLYANKLKTTWDAVYLTLYQLGIQVPKGWSKLGAIAPRYINRFPQLLHDFSRSHRTQVVIMIDEFDSFLEVDACNGWEFLHLLRETAADDAGCAVLIAGYRLLIQTRIKRDNPYYNFTREIELTPLSKEETLQMVETPLARLGIDVSGTSIPTTIHRETQGQPELVQMYCQAVIALHEQRHSIPTDADLMTYVNRNSAFSRTILHTFLKNANPIEQAMCFHLMKRPFDGSAFMEFKIADVDKSLTALGLQLGNADVATLLNNLVVGSFIERVQGAPGRYRFCVPQLVRYCQAVNLDQLLDRALVELRGIAISAALATEPREAI